MIFIKFNKLLKIITQLFKFGYNLIKKTLNPYQTKLYYIVEENIVLMILIMLTKYLLHTNSCKVIVIISKILKQYR